TADSLGQHQSGDFLLQIHRQTEVQQAEHQHRILGSPVFGRITGSCQVHRQLVAVPVQISVDATSINLEEALHPWRAFSVEHLGALAQIDRTHEAVDLQYARPDHFGQSPLSHQAQADHLAQPVGGMDIAQAKQRVVEGRGFNQRHAQGVTPYADTLSQPGQRLYTLLGWQAVAVTAVQICLAPCQAKGSDTGTEDQADQMKRKTQEHQRLL